MIMSQNQRISNKSFERNSKRFLKIITETVDSFSDDYAFKERYDSEAIFIAKKSIEKLVSNYKSKPFRNKSSFTDRIKSFSNVDIDNRELRIQYVFQGNSLIFKFLTRTKTRFNRKCQLVIKFNKDL